ncbi:MAG: hypothetical protein IMX00_04300 [Limnochordales bacterium]|nr:hypothetical protein [Limnochordales bacterium]
MAIHRRVAVASCNAAGKSWLAARAAAWFLDVYRPSVVVTTAPTDRQVRHIIWKEIHAAAAAAERAGHPLGGELLTKTWRFSEEHFAIGFATKDYDPDAFQGLHAPHLLVIADEAAGISEPIWEGIMAILRGQHTRLLAIGNPTSLEGTFFRAFSSPGWWTTHISAFDTPNLQGRGVVIPGLVTPEDVESARQDWGEGSFLWQSRILGQFPTQLTDTLIAITWVEIAANQDYQPEGDVEVGADIARYGSDETVFVARAGACAFAAESHQKQDTMETVGRLLAFADRVQAKVLKVDVVGMGAGVVDRLRELQREGRLRPGVQIMEMNAGAKPLDDRKYADAGTEWWGLLADKLRSQEIGGPVFANRKVISQLTSRKFHYTSSGQMKLQSKEEMRRKGLDSPDWGDAVAMAFAPVAARQDPVTAQVLRRARVYG